MRLLCLGMNDRVDKSPPLIWFGRGLGLFMDEGGFDGYERIITMGKKLKNFVY